MIKIHLVTPSPHSDIRPADSTFAQNPNTCGIEPKCPEPVAPLYEADTQPLPEEEPK